MRIKNLHLENFRGFEKLDIEFPENSNVVVFIGENGSGKSSLIDAASKIIEGFLAQNYFFSNDDYTICFDELDIKNGATSWYVKGTIEDIGTHNLDFSFEFEDLKKRLLLIPDKDKSISSLHLLSIYREKTTNKLSLYDTIPNSGVRVVIPRRNELKQKIDILNSIYADTLNINLFKIKDVFDLWFLSRESRELQVIFDKKDFNFRLNDLEIFRNVIREFYNNLSDAKYDNLKGNRESEAKIFEITNAWIELTKENEILRLDQLSSGELILLMLVADITRRLLLMTEEPSIEKIQQSQGIVLIDEIELHLHPKWQRNIVPALTKTFPNIQFIITTHSPQVLSYVPNGSAFSIENGNAYPVNTYGRDNEWILETIMDDIARPKEIQAKLDTLFDLIRNNEIDKAKQLRKEIATEIGDDEVELLKADILIQRKTRALTHEAH
jgi:predicted ATP-binding protein involved in virulence